MRNNYEKDLSKLLNKVRGDVGETIAVNFLKKQGYKIVQTNFKCRVGEIDVVATKDGVLCFIEVKRRSTLAYGRPIEAVDWHKQNQIRKTAEFYLMLKHKDYADIRFDVVEILDDQCTLSIDAFR